MKLYVLGHEDAVLGFSLLGVEGLSTEDPSAALGKLDALVARGDVGVILVTAALADRMGERLDEMDRDGGLPLVLRIPDPAATVQRPPIRELVRRALGAAI